jgi:hypothetical protein
MLTEIVCSVCGATLGHTLNSAFSAHPFTAWCSTECEKTPLSADPERDEVIMEQFLGMGEGSLRRIAREHHTTRQNIQRILNKHNIVRGRDDILSGTTWDSDLVLSSATGGGS